MPDTIIIEINLDSNLAIKNYYIKIKTINIKRNLNIKHNKLFS
jgi:hypothetical protein